MCCICSGFAGVPCAKLALGQKRLFLTESELDCKRRIKSEKAKRYFAFLGCCSFELSHHRKY